MEDKQYALGIDYGTNSVRALIVDVSNGNEIGVSVYEYPSGKAGVICDDNDPNFARQNPLDYINGLEASVRGAINEAYSIEGFTPDQVIGIGVDTTGSTPIPVGPDGMPLSFDDRFKDDPNAMAWLWKDHTSHEEAAIINRMAHSHDPDYTRYSGGEYSSEWFFAKILHLANVAPDIFLAAASFVEHCDWMVGVLVGETNPRRLLRSRCAAGHKAMWHEEWGGLPSQEFLSSLSPMFDGLRDKLYDQTYTSDTRAGGLCEEWARRLGLREGIAVAVGAFDAHMGAVAAGVKPGTLVKIIGTSSCDMMVAEPDKLDAEIKGICGQVNGSVIPGLIGLEAGQSAVGDLFAWYREQIMWPVFNMLPQSSQFSDYSDAQWDALRKECKDLSFEVLMDKASMLKPGQSGLLGLDWHNGNRCILVDPNLTGLMIGYTLGTKPEEIFMALIEATAFGARVIIDRIEEYGIAIEDVITCGGIAERNPLLMQIYSDILNREMKVSKSAQTCALGAAIFGAVVADAYANVQEAQPHMCGLKDVSYKPIAAHNEIYNRLYSLYRTLHDAFGTDQFEGKLNMIMKDLLAIKRSVGVNLRP